MKEIKMMSGRAIIISDDEYEGIKRATINGMRGLVELRNGDLVNLSSIETITEPETEAYFMGNPMNKMKTKVFVQGEWRDFAGEQSQIEYRIKNNNQKNETTMLE